MKINHFIKSGLFLIFLCSILFGCFSYVRRVQTSLWMETTEHALEITSQGGHTFEIYTSLEQEQVHSLINVMSEFAVSEEDRILNVLHLLGDQTSYYSVVDLDHGYLYSNCLKNRLLVDAEDLEYFRSLSGKGIRENYLNCYDGHKTMGVYECFTFADGTRGLVQKGRRVSQLSRIFSISFFDDTGFSYITNQDGDVMIRPTHKNSNRTFSNIFDMVAGENDEEDIRTFRESLSKGNSGVIQLSFNGSENIITFSPINVVEGWHIISIVPSSVLMDNTDDILQSSWVFVCVISFLFVTVLGFLVFERQAQKRIKDKDQDIRYREQMFGILSENIDDVFVMLNGKSHALEYITPNVDRVLGITKNQIMQNPNTLQDAEYRNGNHLPYPELSSLKPGQSVSQESERIHGKTAEKRWFLESVYCVGNRQSDKLIIVLSDRTREKQNKAMLESALAAANAASKAKSVFFNNVSHDIRTPMNAIIGFATLLDHEADNPERVKEYTHKIMASSHYLLNLLNDVLDMSKIENGKT